MSEKKEANKPGTAETIQNKTKTCFVIMPISSDNPYAAGHFGRVYDYIIEPACRKAGFEPILANRIKAANYIIIDILDQLLKADMVICDISSRNPNVTYELGFRQAFDLPVTLLRDDITNDIFDIQGLRYVRYDHQLRIDLVAQTVNEVTDVINETYANKDKGVYSLVRILGWDKAEVKSSTISGETRIILEAINELRGNGLRDTNRSNSAPSVDVFTNSSKSTTAYDYTFNLKESNNRSLEELAIIINNALPNSITSKLSIVAEPNSPQKRQLHLTVNSGLTHNILNDLTTKLDTEAKVTTFPKAFEM